MVYQTVTDKARVEFTDHPGWNSEYYATWDTAQWVAKKLGAVRVTEYNPNFGGGFVKPSEYHIWFPAGTKIVNALEPAFGVELTSDETVNAGTLTMQFVRNPDNVAYNNIANMLYNTFYVKHNVFSTGGSSNA